MKDFHCPSCGFRVFSRGHPLCEGCSKPLPPDLLFSAAEREQRAEPVALKAPDVMQTGAPRRTGVLGLFDDLVKPLPDRYLGGSWWSFRRLGGLSFDRRGRKASRLKPLLRRQEHRG